MSSSSRKLESTELLLLHAAGELPREERAELERRLAADARLRAELENLRGLQEEVAGYFDATEEAGSGDEALVWRTVREMRRYQVELLARPQPVEATARRRLRRWSYPAAAAAGIIMLIGLWGVGVFDRSAPVGGGALATDDMAAAAETLARVERGFQAPLFGLVNGEALEKAAVHADELRALEESDPLLLMNL